MISTEQPLKKRRLFDHVAVVPPEPSQFSFSSSQGSFFEALPQNPLSQDEIFTKRRNSEEIRKIYDCYKKIRFCVSHKDEQFDSDLEQAYLSLITASRGCPSVKRIVADIIPRYASYCPTALEAAAKVVINMHNWSLDLMAREGNADCVAFETAKTCILGLADICCAASTEASSSSVIRGICSAVFRNSLTFLISAFNGINIFQIVDKEICKMPNSTVFISSLEQKIMDKDDLPLIMLSKFRILSFIRILLSCPKNSLAACFELLGLPCAEDTNREGSWFLKQITSRFGANEEGKEEPESCENSEGIASNDSRISDGLSHFPKNCLLGLVLEKNLSLRRWLFVSFKKLSKLVPSHVFSEVERSLEGFFECPTQLLKKEDMEIDNDEDCLVSSTYIAKNYMIPQSSHEISDAKDCSLKIHNESSTDIISSDKISAKCALQRSVTTAEINRPPSTTPGNSGSTPMEVSPHAKGDITSERSSTALPLSSPVLSSHKHDILPIPVAPSDSRTDSFYGRNQLISNPTIENENSALASPAIPVTHPQLEDKTLRHYDGDPATMNIFPASKQLWLCLLGPEASEALIKFQFERFGPLERLFFFQDKRSAFLEYKNVIDAVRAWEFMHGCSIWGASIVIKFLDSGLGTHGYVNGVVDGSSCHIFVGNVGNIQAKDEIVNESMKVIYKRPKMVWDLSKGVLIEFETAEESRVVMNHLRSLRHASCNQKLYQNGDVINEMGLSLDTQRHVPPLYPDHRSGGHGDMTTLHHSTGIYNQPQMTQLSSMVQSLCLKYNITQNSSYCASAMRESDGLQPSQTIRVGLPKSGFPCLTDSEVMHVCRLASGSAGAVVRLTRADTYTEFSWFVECVSVADSVEILKNLKSCPGIFIQAEFSSPQYAVGYNSGCVEAMSPRIRAEGHGTVAQSESAFRPSFTSYSHVGTHEPVAKNTDIHGSNLVAGLSQGGGHVVTRPHGQAWIYGTPRLPSVVGPGALNVSPVPPRLPSVTPLSHIQLATGPCFTPSFSVPVLRPTLPYPPLSTPLPGLPPSIPLPPPPSPPPLPTSHPPPVPPPPCSPPLPHPPPRSAADAGSSAGNGKKYQWTGQLCKRGFHYATVCAKRVDSGTCNYSNGTPEPAEWPDRLDMTKRTDVRHFKTAFSATPPHKREICWLLPCSAADLKGFRDFLTYLKERDCAGVIKVAGVKPLWPRLVFMVAPSPDVCSLLSLSRPPPPDSAIALVLPKENDF